MKNDLQIILGNPGGMTFSLDDQLIESKGEVDDEGRHDGGVDGDTHGREDGDPGGREGGDAGGREGGDPGGRDGRYRFTSKSRGLNKFSTGKSINEAMRTFGDVVLAPSVDALIAK